MNTMRQTMMRLLPMPDCEQSTERMWMRVHSIPLSLACRIGLRSHLAVCGECRAYNDTLEWVAATLAQVPDAPRFGFRYRLPPDGKERMRNAISQIEMSEE